MIHHPRPSLQFKPISETCAIPNAGGKLRNTGIPAKIGGGLLALLLAAGTFPASGQMAATSNAKFLGNIIKSTTTVDPVFDTYWNQVTPENSGKWGSVEATRDVMNWTQLDFAYNYTRTRGIPFKLHTLVWGQQYPAWMDSLPANEQREEVEEWIAALAARYPGTEYIDVVNEALPGHAPAPFRNALGGAGTTGWDWVIWTFERARHHFPNAKLALNDYDILNSDSATTSYLTIINLLKNRGLIDVIGEQAHNFETATASGILNNLNRLAATGLPIHISELDINIANDADQLAKYQELFPVFWTHSSVRGITLWGYKQGQMWRTNGYLLRTDGSERQSMVWLKQYVAANPQSYCSIITPSSGQVLSNELPISALATASYGTPPYTVTFQMKLDSETAFTTVSSDDTSPYTADLGNLPVGTYQIRLVMTDADSATFTSAVNTFNVTTAPILSSLNPLDNATGVAVGANLVATFSENIAKGTGNITVKNLSDATQTTIAVTDSAQVSISGAVLTINPTANLALNKNYAVQIAATAIKDLSNNAFAGIANDTTWNFATTLLSLYSSGSITWNSTTPNWGIVTGGPYTTATWGSGAAATLEGTAGTVTLAEPIAIKNLTINTALYVIKGSTLNFTAGTIVTLNPPNTNAPGATIESNITGAPAVNASALGTNERFTFKPAAGGSMVLGTITGAGGGGAGIISFQGGAGSTSTVAGVNGPKSFFEGSGTWTLTGLATSYAHEIKSGTVIVSTGTLQANNRSTSLISGTLHYNNPGAVRDNVTATGIDNDFRLRGGSIDNTSGAAITTSTWNPNMTMEANWTFIGSNGAASNLFLGNGGVILTATPQVTVQNAAATLSFGGVISGSGFGLTKAGAGTLELRGASTYTGATTVAGGTLKLGANNVIPNASNVTIGTGTLDADTHSETVGTLDVNGDGVIKLGSGATLAFADSKSVDWAGGTLNIIGTLGANSLRFGDSADDLTSGPGGQLSRISVNGSGLGTCVLDANGYLVLDATPPTLADTSIVDNQGGAAIFENTTVNYTLTFSEDINATTVSVDDFGNAGTSTVTFGVITETSPGVFTVAVTPTSVGTLQLRVNAGAVITDAVGNALNTTSAIVDNTIITVNASNPYAAWALGGVAFESDTNNDGVHNGMAWLLGATHPSENAADKLPAATRNGANLRLTFRCLKSTKRGGTPLKVQSSADLGITDPWINHEAAVPDEDSTVNGMVFDITDDGDYSQVIADIPTDGAKLFVRLSAVNAP